jgi:hypothetical protein
LPQQMFGKILFLFFIVFVVHKTKKRGERSLSLPFVSCKS